ncbi:hypothetical protein [Deinococcus sp.]|uniref:hypothetical protein n=1 Tax=Deinococcus sp. TaxID=47478 RepID=UPI002869BF30|nr:hypothetical protein [Deinococcus sp.]
MADVVTLVLTGSVVEHGETAADVDISAAQFGQPDGMCFDLRPVGRAVQAVSAQSEILGQFGPDGVEDRVGHGESC